jgi:hypothetical protein
MQGHKRIGSIAAAAACVLVGGAVGISQSAAATKSSASSTKMSNTRAHPKGARPNAGPPLGGPGGGSVHSVSEVLNKAGTAYISQTTDSGTITSVDATADTVTLKEGTSTVTYATPTVTIASGAGVTLDGNTSSLSALVAGDHVTITSSSDGTTVFATDASFHPAQGPGGNGGWGGPGPQGPPPSGSSAG